MERRRVSVVSGLSDPSRHPVMESSYSYFAIAGATGDYRLDLKPANTGGSHYRLRLEERRPSTSADELLVAASQAFWRGEKIRKDRKMEEAAVGFPPGARGGRQDRDAA